MYRHYQTPVELPEAASYLKPGQRLALGRIAQAESDNAWMAQTCDGSWGRLATYPGFEAQLQCAKDGHHSVRGRLDGVIAGLLFMAGTRRNEVTVLRWAAVVDATDGDDVLVSVRRSKTNQDGETNDVRYLKNGAACAIRTLRGNESGAG